VASPDWNQTSRIALPRAVTSARNAEVVLIQDEHPDPHRFVPQIEPAVLRASAVEVLAGESLEMLRRDRPPGTARSGATAVAGP
jgi:hypothetical protein